MGFIPLQVFKGKSSRVIVASPTPPYARFPLQALSSQPFQRFLLKQNLLRALANMLPDLKRSIVMFILFSPYCMPAIAFIPDKGSSQPVCFLLQFLLLFIPWDFHFHLNYGCTYFRSPYLTKGQLLLLYTRLNCLKHPRFVKR